MRTFTIVCHNDDANTVFNYFRKGELTQAFNNGVSEYTCECDTGEYIGKLVKEFAELHDGVDIDVYVDQDEEGYKEAEHTDYFVRDSKVNVIKASDRCICYDKLATMSIEEIRKAIEDYKAKLVTPLEETYYTCDMCGKSYKDNETAWYNIVDLNDVNKIKGAICGDCFTHTDIEIYKKTKAIPNDSFYEDIAKDIRTYEELKKILD